jgi:Metallo-peptidase family M12/Calx-beta domain/Domain of unknown function (DUF4214)
MRSKKQSSVFRSGLRRIFLCVIAATLCGSTMFLVRRTAASRFLSFPITLLPSSGQKSAEGVWQFGEEGGPQAPNGQQTPLRAFRRLQLNRAELAKVLQQAPLEVLANQQRPTLSLPMPDGTFQRFAIVESPIMAPELAARYPEIKTYAAHGIDDPTATSRFDWTYLGFHGIVLSAKGTVLIEPQNLTDHDDYLVYFQSSVIVDSAECDVTEADQSAALAQASAVAPKIQPKVVSGSNLRTYRLAVAATAEYTQAYGGGTVPGGLSAVTTTINLVDAIYEREVAVRLTLIANNDAIIFTNTATDGYTSDNVNSLFNENQTRLDSVIGSANYDVGHVFDGRLLGGGFSWQGLGSFNSVCNAASKGRGVDIFRSVSPTNLYAYYSAAHELGHQFNATHTFNTTNGTCGGQRSAATAYEPYDGSTIMGYRLACNPNDLNSTDTYFHNASIEQIVNYTTVGTGSGCPALTATGNNAPTVDAGPSYTIPMGTPFILTATGSDPNGDALTYGWEEFDLGPASPPDNDDGARPIFRSFLPTTSPSRTFPQLSSILSGFTPFGELLPSTMRTMNFRVTARDNRSGGGGINSAATQVNVRSDAGPFRVTGPAGGAIWNTGSTQAVTWNVASTNAGAVNAANVKITLSTDNGTTFPIVLANSTPNDGSEVVTIPGTPAGGSTARIKVEAVGNIFFNISSGFTITGSANTVPTISSFTPGSGSAGTNVTITGTNFINPTAVNFNGTSSLFTVNSTTEIVATVPIGATTGPISVTTASGTAVSTNNFVVNSQPQVQFNLSTYSVLEGPNASLTVFVTRSGDVSGFSTVDYRTTDTDTFTVNCAAKNGAAFARCDFGTVAGTINFSPGETSRNFVVPVVNDGYAEGNEIFGLVLSNPTGATLGSTSTATVTINDNETVDGANPILQTNAAGVAFFVRQHYLDFLGREPEPGEPWSAILNGCSDQFNTNPASPAISCDRIFVSGSFFGSPEFKDKGFYIIGMYRVTFNRLPTYVEFSVDLASISGTTAAEVFAKRAAYATSFVGRTEFTNFYGAMTNTQFVNALMGGSQGQNYNLTTITTRDPANPDTGNKVTLTSTDLINQLTAGTLTRAQVLRAIAQSDEITQNKEAVNAFVASQYFGYLRRTPDTAGFDNWVNHLRNHPNDFRTMINGFMNSSEYRLRFGP